ncbi:microcystin-dependent protein [Ensifer sp. KUDG1]|uniref:phage tail protein n=1 Tax=unclassified Ensifer TaxID=2633371 RepID=UPI0005B8659D|nr:tail fiber protein [Ensifer sp. ZNC0028]
MTEPFVGEIQLFGFDFAPRDWAFCNGTTILIRQNTTLYSLIGVTYGGDGRNTFQLPNFSGRASCGSGTGPGLSPRSAGLAFGADNVTLHTPEMPGHTHSFTAYLQPDSTKRASAPSAGNSLTLPLDSPVMAKDATADAKFAAGMIGPTGGGSSHENRQPFLAVNFSIALQGVFPQFS